MKKNWSLFFSCAMALGMMFLWSCTNEETLLINGVPAEKGKLSFILPMGSSQTVTYGSIPGELAENELSIVKIYMFRPDHLLDQVFSSSPTGDELPLGLTTASPTTKVATINTASATGNYRFYIVVNVNGTNTISATSINLNDGSGVTTGVTTDAEFETLVSNELAKDPSTGDLTLLGCPLPMSMSNTSANGNQIYLELDPSQTQVATAHLNRRVARFDIINHSDFSNFKIEKVYITNANAKGYLQDGQKDTTFVLGSTSVDLLATANGTPIPADSLKDDASLGFGIADNRIPDVFEAGIRDSMELNKAQFYLYPTVLKYDGANKGVTDLVFEGTFDGQNTRTYKLELTKDLPILSNHVYKIKVNRVVELNSKITLSVSEWDWDREDTIPANRDASLITFGHIKLKDPDQGVYINGGDSSIITLKDTIYYTSNTDTEVTIETSGYTLNGTGGNGNVSTVALVPPAASYGYLQEDRDAILAANANNVTSTIKTYGLLYKTTHTLKLPPTIAPIAYEILVSSATNSARKKHYYIVSENYNKIGEKPVKLTYTDASSNQHTILFAPLNVGATKFDTITTSSITAEIAGQRFQWGRNYGFDVAVSVPSSSLASGPINIADTANYSGKFITRTGNSDWLSSPDPDLWGGVSNDPEKMQGPCPNGWRIPTKEMMEALWNGGVRAWKGNTNMAFTLDDGKRIVLQAEGYNNYGGTSTYTSQRGYYWTITPTADGKKSYYLRFAYGDNSAAAVEDDRVFGYAIRAVRDYIPLPDFSSGN
ncbi:MAG: fibrobacter succinogenes major paralogous domain-containing protein [Dysgonamonadaceae bacterium]|jgi:hypothetical protein|nr:fibrobacter succinogenes major paralogous domain-containing protein [Dysgonamonadaceae bacterium]